MARHTVDVNELITNDIRINGWVSGNGDKGRKRINVIVSSGDVLYEVEWVNGKELYSTIFHAVEKYNDL